MSYECLIFDLDGTISDPKDGIVRSINFSLKLHGFQAKGEDEITPHIGPPLDKTFSILTGVVDSRLILSLIEKYRERYSDVGYSENILYEGIRKLLYILVESNKYKLAVCTSKRVDFAKKILEMFGLLDVFVLVNGGDVGIDKWQQIEGLLNTNAISKKSLMIGDRSVDLKAAHKNGLDSAAVLWGYGSEMELVAERPKYIFHDTEALSVKFS